MNDYWIAKYIIIGKPDKFYTVRADDINQATRKAEFMCPRGYILSTVVSKE